VDPAAEQHRVTARRDGGRLLAGLLLVALVARLAFGLGYWTGKPLTHDEREYLHLGNSLATGHGLHYTEAAAGELPYERFGRAPVYPAFVAAVQMIGGKDAVIRNVRIAQSLVGVLAVWIIAMLARRAGGARAALLAAAIAAIEPPLVWTAAFVWSETLYSALALATAAVLARPVDGRDPRTPRASDLRDGLAGGALAGLAVLTRPAMLFFLLLFGIWALARRRLLLFAAVALASLAVVIPWTVRNYREYHRFVLVASEGGITFWTGNHPLSPGEGDLAANPAIKLDSRRLRAAHPALSEEEMEAVYYREAFAAIRRAPLWWIGLLARKAFYTVVPIGPSYTLHSALYFTASVIAYGLLLPFGVLGLRQAWRGNHAPRALTLLASSAVLVSIVFLPQERFRIPVIDPTLIVGSSVFFARFWPHGARAAAL
jgi:4-amino-4-deoxy-L-arabinose transferase-like glycosyltransferase